MTRLEKVHLTFLGAKPIFGVREVMIIGHVCRLYGHKSSMEKIDAIQKIKEHTSTIKI